MNAYVSQALDWLFDPSSRYLVLSIVILLQGAAFIYSRQMRTRAEARLAGAAIESVHQTALAVEAQVAKREDSTALDYPTTRMAPGDDDAPPVSRSQLEEALSLALGPLYLGVESLRVSARTADWLGWASLLIGVFSTTWTLMQSIWPVISHLFQ